MYIRKIFIAAVTVADLTQALDTHKQLHNALEPSKRSLGGLLNWATGLLDRVTGRQEPCPAIWNDISTTLTEQFLADGQCTDAARAAIRASFHDCFNGACDGSLILANECARPENRGLQPLCENLANIASQTGVGVGDLIQFAAAHAIKTCPGGPTVPVKIGREDSSEANAQGVLPGPHAEGGDLVRLFASKGFSAVDLAALIGAHTTARQRQTDPNQAGAPLDSTVGTWDNKFYSETKAGQAPFTLPADKNVAENPMTSLPFSTFALSKSAWDLAFVSAMTKMSMLGVNQNGLIDCTSALPGGSRKREIRASDLWERIKW